MYGILFMLGFEYECCKSKNVVLYFEIIYQVSVFVFLMLWFSTVKFGIWIGWDDFIKMNTTNDECIQM